MIYNKKRIISGNGLTTAIQVTSINEDSLSFDNSKKSTASQLSWFNKLFGFDETTYEETKKKFKIYGDPYEFLIGYV